MKLGKKCTNLSKKEIKRYITLLHETLSNHKNLELYEEFMSMVEFMMFQNFDIHVSIQEDYLHCNIERNLNDIKIEGDIFTKSNVYNFTGNGCICLDNHYDKPSKCPIIMSLENIDYTILENKIADLILSSLTNKNK